MEKKLVDFISHLTKNYKITNRLIDTSIEKETLEKINAVVDTKTIEEMCQETPSQQIILSSGDHLLAFYVALGLLWEKKVNNPIIVTHSYRLKELLCDGAFSLLPSKFWKEGTTFRGTYFCYQVHCSLNVRRDAIYFFDSDHPQLASKTIKIIMCS